MFVHIRRIGGLAALGLTATLLSPALAHAGGPPQAATAYQEALIGPGGGNVSGFGLTATFAPGAVSSPKLIILGNWPNGLDVPPPNGETAVKTFGLQQCNADGTTCTSVFGNFPTAPAGNEKIHGQDTPYTALQPGVAFGSATQKLVTISPWQRDADVPDVPTHRLGRHGARPRVIVGADDCGTVVMVMLPSRVVTDRRPEWLWMRTSRLAAAPLS